MAWARAPLPPASGPRAAEPGRGHLPGCRSGSAQQATGHRGLILNPARNPYEILGFSKMVVIILMKSQGVEGGGQNHYVFVEGFEPN